MIPYVRRYRVLKQLQQAAAKARTLAELQQVVTAAAARHPSLSFCLWPLGLLLLGCIGVAIWLGYKLEHNWISMSATLEPMVWAVGISGFVSAILLGGLYWYPKWVADKLVLKKIQLGYGLVPVKENLTNAYRHLRSQFAEFRRGESGLEPHPKIIKFWQGTHQGLRYRYYHFNYVIVEKHVTAKGEIKRRAHRFDRYGIIFDFRRFQGLAIAAKTMTRDDSDGLFEALSQKLIAMGRDGIAADYPGMPWTTASIEFNRTFEIYAQIEQTAALFLQPAILKKIEQLATMIQQPCLEFAANGNLLISSWDDYIDLKPSCGLENMAQFVQFLQQTKAQAELNQVLDFGLALQQHFGDI